MVSILPLPGPLSSAREAWIAAEQFITSATVAQLAELRKTATRLDRQSLKAGDAFGPNTA